MISRISLKCNHTAHTSSRRASLCIQKKIIFYLTWVGGWWMYVGCVFMVDPGVRGVTTIIRIDSEKHSTGSRRGWSLEAQTAWSKLSHGRGRVPHLLRPWGGAAHLAVSLPRFIGGCALFLLAAFSLSSVFQLRVSRASSESSDGSPRCTD